jgi:hypothetical protein
VSVSPCALARAHRGLISCRLGAKWKRLKAQEGVSKQHGGDAAPMQSEAKSNCCAGLASLIDGASIRWTWSRSGQVAPDHDLISLFDRDLFGKPVPAFPNPAAGLT